MPPPASSPTSRQKTSSPRSPASVRRPSKETARSSTTSSSPAPAATPCTCATHRAPAPPRRSRSRSWWPTDWTPMYNREVRHSRPPRGFFRKPRGYVDGHEAGAPIPRAPAHVIGWCLCPGTSVARVEISVNGGPPERARLALERTDIAEDSDHPDAPISAFEHKAYLSTLPPGTNRVRIEATAHSLDGRVLEIEPVEFPLGASEPAFHDEDGTAAELRERSIRALRQPRPHRPGIRLLAFSHMLVHGGGSLYLLQLLSRLNRERGFECEVVSLADGPLRAEFEALGIPVHLTDGFPVTSLERYEGNMAELVAWAAAGGFDAVLANTLASFAGADLAPRLKVPCIWAVHESFPLPMFWHTAYEPGALHPY